MNSPPTRDEILEELRAVLDRYSGPISVETKLPKAVDCQRDGIWLQIIGTVKGWLVVAKKNAMGIILMICLYGDFRQGTSTIVSDASIAIESISKVVEYSVQHFELPATEFAMVDPPPDWPIPPSKHISVAVTTPTPTTTPPPTPPRTVTGELLPGSGLVPRSQSWRYYG